MTIQLTTFIPGTKAKADEVNANFAVLQSAINEKATINGDSSQTFLVSDATADKHAVNKKQLNELSDNLTTKINRTGTKFCIKSGNTTNGKGDLFSIDVYEINAKIGGTYDSLTMIDYAGTQTTISSTPAKLSLTGNSNGEYNIFITPAGTLYILNNVIYKQASRPTMTVNDIWLDTSTEPFKCIKYSGSSDITFLDVPLGKVSFSNGAITQIETFAFNQNNYNINSQSIVKSGSNLANSISTLCTPDWAHGVSKSFGVTYTAETSGYLYVLGSTATARNLVLDGATIQYTGGSVNNAASSLTVPIGKGTTYSATSGDAFTFFPMKST